MVENLLEYKKSEVKIILFGSGAMYDKTRSLHKVKEDSIGNVVPKDLYGKSKMILADLIKKRSDALMLNIFACYGYGEKETRFPSYAINQVLKGENIVINQDVIFDYLFVEDMQKIVAYFIEHSPEENIINITPSESVSLRRIAQIANSLGENKVDIIISAKDMNNEYTGDNTRLLKNYLNFQFTSIEAGIAKLFKYNKDLLKEAVSL